MVELYAILNIVSLIAGVLSIVMMMVLGWKQITLMKRVSLQLQTGIAFLDVTRHIRVFNLHVSSDTLCILTAFYGFFSDHLYVFLNMGIAINLHLLLLKQIQPKPFLKWVYWIVAIGTSLVINFFPLSLKYLGKSSDGYCYLIPNTSHRKLVKVFLVHLINWPGVIYCLIISVLVLYQYYFKISQEKQKTIYSEPEIRQLCWTIALYPLTCFLTSIGYLIYSLVYDGFDYHSYILEAWMLLGLSSTGLINLISLLIDHQVWSAIKSLCNPNQNQVDLELGNQNSSNDSLRADKDLKNSKLYTPNTFGSYEEQRESLIRFL